MSTSASEESLRPFAGEEHEPFYWPGGQDAALLIHGFPGTPAEMRAAGTAIHDAGWTVQGLLLPGFGPGIVELSRYGEDEWLTAVREAAADLRKTHERVVLVGNSMGAALSITVAAQGEVAGLILFSPFWRVDNKWIDTFFPLIRLFRREMRPFEDADFSDPELREAVGRFLADVDLDDPAVQETLRSLSLPMSTLGEVRNAGRTAYRRAAEVHAPALVVQGATDEVARPFLSRMLAQRLPNLTGYVEVDAGHDLIHGNSASGDGVCILMRRFLARLDHTDPAS